MQKNLFKISSVCLLTLIIASAPLSARAENPAPKAPAASDAGAPVKTKGTAFIGDLTAVDATAMTLTVSNLVLHVTADTVIKKGSQPAKLSDAVVGQPTRGTYEKGADDKLTALTVHLNSKAGGKGGKTGTKKKKDATDSTTKN